MPSKIKCLDCEINAKKKEILLKNINLLKENNKKLANLQQDIYSKIDELENDIKYLKSLLKN